MPQSPLEIRHLRTLVALRDAGSIVRAAPLLHLTQSALSHQLRQIESYFGAALFERKAAPVVFSSAGSLLLALAEQILAALQQTEREVFALQDQAAGHLRIAVECHTCFDWLMPSMDHFRPLWPQVELDIVSGFHTDPVHLLHRQEAELAIVSETALDDPAIDFYPLFTYEIVAVHGIGHPFEEKPFLNAADFENHTLISYPVPDDMIDLIRQVLRPSGISVTRRSAELTIAILQLVASGRGVSALPAWAVDSYVKRNYVSTSQIGPHGLFGKLYAAIRKSNETGEGGPARYIFEFIQIMRQISLVSLPGITIL